MRPHHSPIAPVLGALALLVLILAGVRPIASRSVAAVGTTDSDALPPEKQAIVDAMASAEQAARDRYGPDAKNSDDVTVATLPPDTNQYVDEHVEAAGGVVVESSDAMPGNDEVEVSNLWTHHDPLILVYAGVDRSNPSVGEIVVSHGSHDLDVTTKVKDHGALRIVGGQDESLDLMAADGTKLSFDPYIATLSG